MEQSQREKDFQAASEIGKIFNSFLDKKLLCEFYLESTASFIEAGQAYLFMAGNNDKLWTEASVPAGIGAPQEIMAKVCEAYQKGKNVCAGKELFIPLIVRNSAIGLAYFSKKDAPFQEHDMMLASDMSCQVAAALKNIFLFEDNLRMERLATIGQTMSAVMHELKNIIQLASLSKEFLKMSLDKHQDDKHLTRGFNGVEKALKEMDGFTYEILSLTKDYRIQPQKADLQALFDELKEDVRPKAEQWKIVLDFKADAEVGPVDCEPRSLYRTLLNLIRNAIEASDKPEPFLHLYAKSLGDRYEIRLEDNGKGMSEEVKAKIFQAFFSTKGERGTGLGLLIIDKTVKAHGGEVKVESELGKGTTFILNLPKKIAEAA